MKKLTRIQAWKLIREEFASGPDRHDGLCAAIADLECLNRITYRIGEFCRARRRNPNR